MEWFKEQSFYNETAHELIEEWISNKRFIEEEDERQLSIEQRFALQRARCSYTHEPTPWENCPTLA